jgi:hypothetical protein
VKYCSTYGTAKSKDTTVFCSYCGTRFWLSRQFLFFKLLKELKGELV